MAINIPPWIDDNIELEITEVILYDKDIDIEITEVILYDQGGFPVKHSTPRRWQIVTIPLLFTEHLQCDHYYAK